MLKGACLHSLYYKRDGLGCNFRNGEEMLEEIMKMELDEQKINLYYHQFLIASLSSFWIRTGGKKKSERW